MVSQPIIDYSKRKNSNLFFQNGNSLSSCKAPDHGRRNSGCFNQQPLAGFFRFAYLMLIISVTLGSLIKSNEARLLEQTSDTNIDWDCREYPCFCDEVFFRFCPDKDYCKVRRLPKYSDHIPAEFAEPSNNIFDPDHLEPSVMARSSLEPSGLRIDQEMPDNNQANGKIVTVRKVKIEVPEAASDIHIHPVRVTIPVKVNNELAVVPPPKHRYKMNEYITEERKLETEMVPVTETVIKPVGISKDQIINTKRA